MRLAKTPRFERAFRKLPIEVQDATLLAITRFMSDARHPSLHFEKLKGSEYRTIRVDRGRWRIVLRGSGAQFDLVDVDRHKKVDSKYG